MSEEPLYRMPAAAAAAGMSYRQADHWVSVGHVTVARDSCGSGCPRLVNRDQVARMIRIRALTERGITLRVAADPPPDIAQLVDDEYVRQRLTRLDSVASEPFEPCQHDRDRRTSAHATATLRPTHPALPLGWQR